MRLLVFGSRDYTNKQKIMEKIVELNPTVIIHGNAVGADSLAAMCGLLLSKQVISFPAQWSKYHRAAGPIRNQQMLDEGKPDKAIGFSDHWNTSKGSIDMFKRCIKHNIPVERY